VQLLESDPGADRREEESTPAYTFELAWRPAVGPALGSSRMSSTRNALFGARSKRTQSGSIFSW
jgi:hypothetical protein